MKNSAQAINKPTFDYRQHSKNVVGAKRQSFTERLRIWLGNYKNLGKIHQMYFARSNSIYEISKGTEYEEFAYRSKAFCETLINTYRNSRLKSGFIVLKLFFGGKYSAFYTGFRGFIRDLIYVLLLESRS